ncbi:hypothetical protein AQUCO_00700141v1 [Aquilegia coerulea]|uniref:1-acylglycerol-3-phosphate O-acyltransferase n=1 Tax=Aquilegia coerulea TaxID=218851 RepID=A0A2G5EIN6_AQUCA|nr:hypothetical protein AQUCO_00700141v1 [Aquilegia coerulea]PIA55625.1 hypothetical protein AQUCO_00700141v1 [Aquilegia coerulea]
MEVCSSHNSDVVLKHRPLTALRVLRGLLCLLVILSTAFMMLVYCAPVTAVALRLFSIHYSRKATSYLFGAWLALWPFLFEKINNTKVVFSGDTVPSKERILLIANHRTEVDWMYLWDLALRKGSIGYIKYILKSSLMRLPVFGWVFHILEFISVERKWELDEPNMRQMLSTLTDPQDPLWLAVFPEGTDFTEQKCIRSQKYASENALPILQQVLLPKTKGFSACLDVLRSSLDAVYDVTIGYKRQCPLFMDNVFGVDPSEVHIHIQRFSLDEIPISEDEAAAWLIDRFHIKDQLLSDFIAEGHFPHQGSEGDLSSLNCLVNSAAVIAFTGTCTYLTLFSSIWFRIYVALSCAYLASATYLNIRPVPIVGFLDSLFIRKTSCSV